MATQVIDPRRADILAGHAQSVATRRLGELFVTLNAWLERRRHYRATVAELSALSDQLLADVGVKRSEIGAVAERAAQRAAPGW
jgi:uncharacterized protein YjiS (DUF1127 family)